MSTYAHKTSNWATGHALSDDDVAPRATGDDKLPYLERVKRMVAFVLFMPDRYVNVTIVCDDMSYSIAVLKRRRLYVNVICQSCPTVVTLGMSALGRSTVVLVTVYNDAAG